MDVFIPEFLFSLDVLRKLGFFFLLSVRIKNSFKHEKCKENLYCSAARGMSAWNFLGHFRANAQGKTRAFSILVHLDLHNYTFPFLQEIYRYIQCAFSLWVSSSKAKIAYENDSYREIFSFCPVYWCEVIQQLFKSDL